MRAIAFVCSLGPCLCLFAFIVILVQSSASHEAITFQGLHKRGAGRAQPSAIWVNSIAALKHSGSGNPAINHVERAEMHNSSTNIAPILRAYKALAPAPIFAIAPLWFNAPNIGRAQPPSSTPKSHAPLSLDKGSAFALLVALGGMMFVFG